MAHGVAAWPLLSAQGGGDGVSSWCLARRMMQPFSSRTARGVGHLEDVAGAAGAFGGLAPGARGADRRDRCGAPEPGARTPPPPHRAAARDQQQQASPVSGERLDACLTGRVPAEVVFSPLKVGGGGGGGGRQVSGQPDRVRVRARWLGTATSGGSSSSGGSSGDSGSRGGSATTGSGRAEAAHSCCAPRHGLKAGAPNRASATPPSRSMTEGSAWAKQLRSTPPLPVASAGAAAQRRRKPPTAVAASPQAAASSTGSPVAVPPFNCAHRWR